jgi:hypothetical protein
VVPSHAIARIAYVHRYIEHLGPVPGGCSAACGRARLRQRRDERGRARRVPRARRRRGGHPRLARRSQHQRPLRGHAHGIVGGRGRSRRRALGLAFDGDGDRVIAVDHLGNAVDGDRLIALAALQLRDEGHLHDDTVVVTVMSNLGFHKAMAAHGIRVVTTAVGDRYVLEALDAGGYSVGGEQSGHIIYRDLATTGDGLLAGLRLAEHVHVRTGSPLAELAGGVMTSYPQVLVNVKVAERHPHIADELAAEIAEAEAGARRRGSHPGAGQRHRAADAGDGRGRHARARAVDRRRAAARPHPSWLSRLRREP